MMAANLATWPRERLLAALAHTANSAPNSQAALRRALEAQGHRDTPRAVEESQGATGDAGGARTQGRDTEEQRPRTFCCSVTPVGKPRQTQSDKWKERPAVVRYRQYADELRAWAERVRFSLPESGCTIRFELPMPDSWSKAKKAAMDGEPHQQRPDVDNLGKGVLDALLAEDCRVWHVSIEKRWARDGAVVFILG